jgi:acyl dehydratase
MQSSLYFEDLTVGMSFSSAMSEPFTLESIAAFESLTKDRAHVAVGERPPQVQGNFLVSLTGGLLFEAGHFVDTLFAQARKDTRFVRPVFVGERIYATETIVALEDRPQKPYGSVKLMRTTFNERHEMVLETTQEYRVHKRTSAQ